MALQIEALKPDHVVAGFDSGRDSLDRYLRNEALRAAGSGLSRTHVLVDTDNPSLQVLGYCTVMPTTLTSNDSAPVPKKGLGSRTEVPGYLIAKLGVDRRSQGGGLGTRLLVGALELIVRAADCVGGRVIVVDAGTNELVDFYQRLEFVPIPASMRLWLHIDTARAAVVA